MANHQRPEYVLRHAVINHLSDGEVARVIEPLDGELRDGDEFLDMAHLSRGVQLARSTSLRSGPLLPRKAMEVSTWRRILAFLEREQLQAHMLHRPV